MDTANKRPFDEMQLANDAVRDIYALYAEWLHDVPLAPLESKTTGSRTAVSSSWYYLQCVW